MATLTRAKEQSTYVLDVSFFDETQNLIVPNEATWTLTDGQGNTINLLVDVAIEEEDLAATVSIVLSGDDLALQDGEITEGKRILLIKATYDSDLGMNLPLNEEIVFYIDNLLNIS